VKDEISKRLGRLPQTFTREPQASWSRFFPSLDAGPSPPETKNLSSEESSFIERYLKLADELLRAAAMEERNLKTKKTG
jgi:hypothetical protein